MPAPLPITTIGTQQVAFGTVEINQSFGTVEQASLNDFVTEYEIPDAAGGIQALLLLNPGLEFKFTAMFTTDVEKPARGTPIAFPQGGVIGNILTAEITWEGKGQRKIAINAKYWESMGSNPTVGQYDPNA